VTEPVEFDRRGPHSRLNLPGIIEEARR
jgi:hypothetical protein